MREDIRRKLKFEVGHRPDFFAFSSCIGKRDMKPVFIRETIFCDRVHAPVYQQHPLKCPPFSANGHMNVYTRPHLQRLLDRQMLSFKNQVRAHWRARHSDIQFNAP